MKFKKTDSNPRRLGEKVYTDLRKMILTGRIPSGTRLVESVLAREMGVSRTPVREALHKLSLERLVYSIPRAGYMVSDLSEPDLDDLFATRAAIEQLAARWALDKITTEEMTRLEQNLKRTDKILKDGATRKMIDLDTEFHEVICKATRSRRVYEISQMLREHMLRFRMICLHVPEIAKRARDGHVKILRALKSKDPRALDEAILTHMADTKRDIQDYMKRMRESHL